MDPLVIPESPHLHLSPLSPAKPQGPDHFPLHYQTIHSNSTSKLPHKSSSHEQQDYLNKYLVSINKYSFPPKDAVDDTNASPTKINVTNSSPSPPSNNAPNGGYIVVSGTSQRYHSPYAHNSGSSLTDKLKARINYHKQCCCSLRFFLLNLHNFFTKGSTSKQVLSFFCYIVSFLFIILLGSALLCVVFWGEFSLQSLSDTMQEQSRIYRFSVDQLQLVKHSASNVSAHGHTSTLYSSSTDSSTDSTSLSNVSTEQLIAQYPFESFRDEWRQYVESSNLSQFISHIDTSISSLFTKTKYSTSMQLIREALLLNQLYGIFSELEWFVGCEILGNGSFEGTQSQGEAFKGQQRVYYLLQRERTLLSHLQLINVHDYQPTSEVIQYVNALRMHGDSLIAVDRSQYPEVHSTATHPAPVTHDEWHSLTVSLQGYIRSKLEIVEQRFGSSESNVKRSSTTTFAVCLTVFISVSLCCLMYSCCFTACTKIMKHFVAKRKYEEIVLALSAASEWDLTNPCIERLLSIPEHKATALEAICQIIVHQLSDVKPYLPTHIFDQDPLADLKPRSFSIESSVSSTTSHGGGGTGGHHYNTPHGENDSTITAEKLRANSFSESFLSSPSPSSMSHRFSVISSRLGSSKQLAFNLKRRRSTITSTRNNAGLVEKEATLMMIDVVDFHSWVQKHDLESFNDNYHRFVTTVCDLIRHERGMIHWISGDKIFCTFGCASKLFQSENKACQSALSIVRLTKTKLSDLGISVRIGIASGKVLAGPIGNKTFKTFSCIGTIVNRLYSLCRLNKHYSSEILIDVCTFQASQTHFVARMVDCVNVRGDNDAHEPLRIYELLESKQVSENEWMYQLSESEEKEKFRNYHSVWDQCLKQNYQQAEFLLDKLMSENPQEAKSIPADLLKRLKTIIHTGRRESKLSHSNPLDQKWRYEANIQAFGIRTNVDSPKGKGGAGEKGWGESKMESGGMSRGESRGEMKVESKRESGSTSKIESRGEIKIEKKVETKSEAKNENIDSTPPPAVHPGFSPPFTSSPPSIEGLSPVREIILPGDIARDLPGLMESLSPIADDDGDSPMGAADSNTTKDE